MRVPGAAQRRASHRSMSRPASSGRELSQASTPATMYAKEPPGGPGGVETEPLRSPARTPRLVYYPPLFSYAHTKRNASVAPLPSRMAGASANSTAHGAPSRGRPCSAPSNTPGNRRPTRAETSGLKELSWTIGAVQSLTQRVTPDINSRRSLQKSRLPPTSAQRLEHMEQEAAHSAIREAREEALEELRDRQASSQKEFIERRDQIIEQNSR